MHRDPPRHRARPRSPTTVVEAIAARLAKVTVGNPANDDVRMGALASLDQREEVRKAVQALRGSAEIVFGDPDHVEVVDADAERGAFMSPVLLRAAAGAGEPHDVEAFGPVGTVIGYDDLDDADRARRPRLRQPGRLARHPRPRGRPHR